MSIVSRSRVPLRVATVLASAVVALAPAGSVVEAQTGPPRFPERLERFLTDTVALTPGERRRLLAGEVVTKMLDADPSKEVAILGVVWIDAPRRRYVEAVSDIERFERGGGFKVTRRISSPPRLADFAELRIPDEDLRDLKDCRVGDCAVKLGEASLRRFQTEIDWSAPDAPARANALIRQLALDYVTRYLAGGNERLAVYRDSSRPMFVAREFEDMVAAMPVLSTHMPEVRRYLLEYPRVTLPNATSFLYWQETAFGLKPTIRISHLTIQDNPDDTVVTSKMLYASHYFWTGLELRVLIPDPARGRGFWLVTVNRSRSDGLSGFTGRLLRGRVRSQAENGTRTALLATKRRLEGARR